MIEVMRKDFSEHRQMLVTITKNQLGAMKMIAGEFGMDYPNAADSK